MIFSSVIFSKDCTDSGLKVACKISWFLEVQYFKLITFKFWYLRHQKLANSVWKKWTEKPSIFKEVYFISILWDKKQWLFSLQFLYEKRLIHLPQPWINKSLGPEILFFWVGEGQNKSTCPYSIIGMKNWLGGEKFCWK